MFNIFVSQKRMSILHGIFGKRCEPSRYITCAGYEVKNGYMTPAFSAVPNRGTKSEVTAQIMPSWGPERMPPPKTELFESKHMG